jgi:hypothetical protein
LNKITPTNDAPSYHQAKEIVGVLPPSGKRVMFSQEALEKDKSRRPMTKSAARKLAQDEEIRFEIPIHFVVE